MRTTIFLTSALVSLVTASGCATAPVARPTPSARGVEASASASDPLASIPDPLLKRWRASCPVKPLFGGICAKYELPGGATRCAAGVDAVVVVPRGPDGARVQREASRGLASSPRPEQRAAWRFIRAEQLFEAFLAKRMPVALKPRRLVKVLVPYLRAKSAALRAARAAYEPLAKSAPSPLDRAALLRLGLLYVSFGRELMLTAVPQPPTPASLTSPSAREEFRQTFARAFCDSVEGKAAPLLKKGIGLLGGCARWRPRQDEHYRACRRASKEAKALLARAQGQR